MVQLYGSNEDQEYIKTNCIKKKIKLVLYYIYLFYFIFIITL